MSGTVEGGHEPHLVALGRGSQRWNWFLAADYLGTWIVTNGIADVRFTSTGLDAILHLNSELPPYHVISATISSDWSVEAIVSSPGPGRAERFKLVGRVYFGEEIASGGQSRSVLMTDGTTVLGLAFGLNSGKPNP